MTLRELRDLLQTAPEEWLDGEIYATSNLAICLPGHGDYVGFVDLVEKRLTWVEKIYDDDTAAAS